MRRREFIALVGGSVAGWPLAARAQKRRKVWRVGALQPGAPPDPLLETIKDGLRDLGHVEGRDLVFEPRWAEGKHDRLAGLAAELVGLKVDVIYAFSTPLALAARQATSTIPIVFSGVGDPVGTGLVANLAHPGGNVTGLSVLATELSGKRFEMLREIIPAVSRVAMLWNNTNPSMVLRANETQDAAAKLGVTIHSIGVHDLIDFEDAFKAVTDGRAAALIILADPFTMARREQLVELAAKRSLPAIYEIREFAEAGGLISYGPSVPAMQRRVAVYLDKIFKGAKPSDLPVEQPTKFQLVINLKTARSLGLEIPPSLLARADEVIE